MCCTHRFAVWLDGRECVGPFCRGFDYAEHKFGQFRESGYSALRDASVRTPQLLRPKAREKGPFQKRSPKTFPT